MRSASFFPSKESQKRWREHMSYNYIESHDIRPCVFQLPDFLRETKPEAYIPQIVGLGPYHHFRPEVQLMASKKRDAVRDYLGILDSFKDFVNLIMNSPDEFEPKIRSCYDRYIDLDKETLSWIVIVDGIFLLHFIDTYLGPEEEKHKIYSDVEKLVPDVFMLENQIPVILILEVREVLGLTYNVASDIEVFDKFIRFCSKHSPLELTSVAERQQAAFDKNNHMLHFMYQMIMKNQGGLESETESGISEGAKGDTTFKNIELLAKVAADHVGELYNHVAEEFNSALERAKNAGLKVPGNIQKVSQLLQNVEKTFQFQRNKEVLAGDQIEIPSVSRLFAILNIKFKPLPRGCGIQDIDLKSNDGKEFKFYLPVITLRPSSEVIFRNLVAYEATVSKQEQGTTRLRDFVDLMCGLIKSDRDVQLLKDAKIIKGELSNPEIVNICNRIRKSDEKPDDESKVHSTVKGANTHFNNSTFVKFWRGITKIVAFVVKIFRVLFPFLILAFLGFQSACEIFDCRIRPKGVTGNLYLGDYLELNPQAKLMLPRKLLPY